ncbi:MAG: porin family protein, partial [Alphaproteobacteria bacterium]|nr:porin family protein [Alphaproteobacteria bacterium]
DVTTTFTGPTSGADIYTPNAGYILGGTIGVELNSRLRAELELSHSRWNMGSNVFEVTSMSFSGTLNRPGGYVEATYLLSNAWLNLTEGERITPYVGGGVGVAWVNMNNTFAMMNAAGPSFAFQVGGGFTFAVSDQLSIDLGYRFKDVINPNLSPAANFTDPKTTDYFVDSNLASHNFQLGITYRF